jgi:hypothetical protein
MGKKQNTDLAELRTLALKIVNQVEDLSDRVSALETHLSTSQQEASPQGRQPAR